nr:photosynthetic reaction center subunit H [Oceanococcus sp. HetDA_MAG_MS8]
MTGAITSNIDVAQMVLYVFWVFFAGLIFYLHRENKREGYPLECDPPLGPRNRSVGFPDLPDPKTWILADGSTLQAPRPEKPAPELQARKAYNFPGAPLDPVGDPLSAGVGPGSYAQRDDEPDLMWDGSVRMAPTRLATEFHVDENDPDPRGMPVWGLDGEAAGEVVDFWVDKAEPRIIFLEMALASDGTHVLIPMNFVNLRKNPQRVQIDALKAEQFAGIPRLKDPDQATRLEEDKIMAYYGAGTLYATQDRLEPLL